jgi:1,4-alpha-glucan branching enzyme
MLKKSFSKTKPVCKVTFSLPLEAARGGKEVRVLGDFNHWSWEKGYRMTAGKTEYSVEVELDANREYQFRYLIDNHIWENDWKADRYTPAAYGEYNSVLSLIQEKAEKKVAEKKPEVKKAAAPKKVAEPKVVEVKEVKKAVVAKSTVKVAPQPTEAPKPVAKKAPAKKATTKK